MNTELLQKFYSGECTEEEVQKVLSWFSSRDDKEVLMEQIKNSWMEFEVAEDFNFNGYDSGTVLENISRRIMEKEAEHFEEAPEAPVIQLSGNRYYSLRVASVIALAVCASFVWHFWQSPVLSDQRISSQIVVNEIPSGERRTIILEDGTEITLNAGSKLSYPEHFPENERQVELEGEAFFEVARDESRPFTVVTEEVLTTVLGTSFNIKAEDEETVVAVASGKVKVSYQENSCLLLPGKAVTFNDALKSLSPFEFDEREVLSWKEGILYFREASYEEVEKKIEQWYGVSVEASGKGNGEWNNGWQYTGSFKDQSLENVLLSIGYVKNFSYSVNGSRVEVNFHNP